MPAVSSDYQAVWLITPPPNWLADLNLANSAPTLNSTINHLKMSINVGAFLETSTEIHDDKATFSGLRTCTRRLRALFLQLAHFIINIFMKFL